MKVKLITILYPTIEELKQKHFPHNPDEPVILHRKDIINKKGPFWRLKYSEREKAFNEDILSFFDKMEYTVVTIVIDKKAHIEQYHKFAYNPYSYCLALTLERYCGFLNFFNGKGDVLAESRNGREDMQLREAYENIYKKGTRHRPSDFFQKVLTSKEIKIKPKIANIAGLQLADLLAYPLKQEILVEKKRILPAEVDIFGRRICEIIKKKYNRQFYTRKICGYGKVFLK